MLGKLKAQEKVGRFDLKNYIQSQRLEELQSQLWMCMDGVDSNTHGPRDNPDLDNDLAEHSDSVGGKGTKDLEEDFEVSSSASGWISICSFIKVFL